MTTATSPESPGLSPAHFQTVITRLRGTAGKNGTRYKTAYSEGQRWASEDAELDDLEQLEAVDIDDLCRDFNRDLQAVAHRVADLVLCDPECIFEHYEEGRVIANDIRGFVDGALEVLRNARPHLS